MFYHHGVTYADHSDVLILVGVFCGWRKARIAAVQTKSVDGIFVPRCSPSRLRIAAPSTNVCSGETVAQATPHVQIAGGRARSPPLQAPSKAFLHARPPQSHQLCARCGCGSLRHHPAMRSIVSWPRQANGSSRTKTPDTSLGLPFGKQRDKPSL